MEAISLMSRMDMMSAETSMLILSELLIGGGEMYGCKTIQMNLHKFLDNHGIFNNENGVKKEVLLALHLVRRSWFYLPTLELITQVKTVRLAEIQDISFFPCI